MKLLSIQVGQARPMQIGNRTAETAIDKRAVDGPRAIGPQGVDGDVQADKQHHGGLDQAVYVYSADDYAWWSQKLSREVPHGSFGENLVLSKFDPGPPYIGDRLAVGAVVLEITSPRIPCGTLAAHIGDSEFVKQFRHAERPGVYCRVIEPGTVTAGDRVEVMPGDRSVSVLEIFRLFFDKAADPQRVRHALTAPLAERAREIFLERLERPPA